MALARGQGTRRGDEALHLAAMPWREASAQIRKSHHAAWSLLERGYLTPLPMVRTVGR
jgi:hypothetical protein